MKIVKGKIRLDHGEEVQVHFEVNVPKRGKATSKLKSIISKPEETYENNY